MSEHNKADQARKGLIDSVKGKAKEVFGAVTGNESLTAEGQLEQTQAQERKEANSVEAVADAEASQAGKEAAEAKIEGAHARADVNAEAAVVESDVRAQHAARRQAVERAGQQDAARAKAQAEAGAQHEASQAKVEERANIQAASGELSDAIDEHRTAEHVTAGAQAQAQRIRERADRVTAEADLP
ncbi:CsbD family protein [Mycolicibacterium fluoranthenivorans]|uniref:Uncharacterized protein YjbJ (UPF0337 family) n=1 Tax=Mycolicibacterium fluoranthenivorans TaxID=258505 RepID=A0A7X5TWX5_9MYCO|nr:CsbD family protein [Mycolicibacterium fluoranthenivorans]MCV7356869.1 CsbD family protein [Mycolicibacterium fluoranthenivorans]NIH94262.1 uncharacterized protein YjbJ (UPF0337 family) [Mycolicibacterium fluoranthenivorans]